MAHFDIAVGPGDPKTWTLGLCRTLVTNLPDLWDFIQPKLHRLALSLLYAGQKIHPGSYSEASEYNFRPGRRPGRKNRRKLPTTKTFINYVAPRYRPATMDVIFDHWVVPTLRLMHLRTGFPWKITIGLQNRLNLRGTEDATAAVQDRRDRTPKSIWSSLSNEWPLS